MNLTDMEANYKAFRKEVLQQLTLVENRFGIEPEITAKQKWESPPLTTPTQPNPTLQPNHVFFTPRQT